MKSDFLISAYEKNFLPFKTEVINNGQKASSRLKNYRVKKSRKEIELENVKGGQRIQGLILCFDKTTTVPVFETAVVKTN